MNISGPSSSCLAEPAIRMQAVGKLYPWHGDSHHQSLRTAIGGALRRNQRERTTNDGGHANGLWALRGVTLEVSTGEAIGIVGRNGSGKSTLLRLLARVTTPTEGRIELRGKVAPLLQIGTGFHGDLTGRENISLTAALLGMARQEIARKLDEIVEFAEIEEFLDTPVRHYSTGMYLRLAFSIAIHLDSDIILADEILAVGDVGFQARCLDRLAASHAAGRTVILVSHDLAAIRRLCTRAIYLESGRIKLDSDADTVTESIYFDIMEDPNHGT